MRRQHILLGTLALSVASAAGAQAAPDSTLWSPFLGCWSTSSNGSTGPMVCIVPADSGPGAEFMTIDGDSVVARALVTANGRTVRDRRGECQSAESASWSKDARRVFIHAAVKCGKNAALRSDAMLAMVRRDAFVHVERVTNSDAPARVVNFIVQLDTTVYPAEVRRRLPGYRALALDAAELEKPTPIAPAEVYEAAQELDPQVVRAWLDDRGERQEIGLSELRRINVTARGGVPTVQYGNSRFGGNVGVMPNAIYGTQYVDDRYRFSRTASNSYITPAMVGFGLPYLGYMGGFTWAGWPR